MTTAIELFDALLSHVIDAPYTVEQVEEKSPVTIVIGGQFDLTQGLISDQLQVGLRTYFKVTRVWYSVNPGPDGWLAYSAMLTRKTEFRGTEKWRS